MATELLVSGERVPRRIDVAVVGSGGAALVAALRARDQGSTVLVIEKSPRIGGTTAVSGGMPWVPRNHHMSELGVADSRREALTYLRRSAFGQSTEELLEAFVDQSPEMLRYLESRTCVSFRPLPRPDYHPEWEGAKDQGRILDVVPFDTRSLGDYAELLRRSPHYPPMTYQERHEWGSPERFDWELISRRVEEGIVTLGAALVGGLLKTCLDSGILFAVDTRAHTLKQRGERVARLKAARHDGADIEIEISRSVVVACGGFEWDARMKRHFLRGPELAAATPPWNTGDGIRMGLGVGAALTNMNEAAWMTVLRIPGEEYDGAPGGVPGRVEKRNGALFRWDV